MSSSVLQELQSLHQLGNALWTVENLSQVLQSAADSVSSLLPADRVSLIVFDEKKSKVDYFMKGGAGKENVETTIDFGELQNGLTGWVLEHGVPALSSKLTPDPREAPQVRARRAATNCGSIIVVPLRHGEKTLGTMTAINRPEQRDFVQEDVDVLVLFANYCVLVLANAQLILDLKVRTQEAEQASLIKSRFLANMSHEIRTPLNAVLGFLELLGRSGLDPRQKDYASQAEGSARTLLGMLNDVLDFSKLEAGKMEADVKSFRLDQLLEGLSTILSALVREKEIEVRFEVGEGVPNLLSGDSLRLQQILLNLLGNAAKFTETGTIVLQVDRTSETVDKTALRFEVRDTGIGIAPEMVKNIFDSFVQGEASTTRRYGGTGLGLAICRRLVILLGGNLEVVSTLGQGSRFFFTIPFGRVQTEPVLEPPVRSTEDRPLAGLHLLVVEDNKINRLIAQEILKNEGARVTLATSGAQALEFAARTTFDAVLMDIQMPGMDGYETTRSLRLITGPDLPILATTANVLSEEQDKCLAAGMNGHISKPLDVNELVSTLKRFLKPKV